MKPSVKLWATRASFVAVSLSLSACSSLSWFTSSDKKILPLPAVTGSASVSTQWQSALGGKQTSSLIPAVANGKVFAAHPSGAILVLDEKSGSVIGRFQIPTGKGIVSGGVAASADMMIVGTNKAEVIALDLKGSVLWTAKVSSEVIAPAAISDAAVVVLGGDGSITALDPKTGAQKWTVQRVLPALTVRSSAIPITVRGAVFVGTAQDRKSVV